METGEKIADRPFGNSRPHRERLAAPFLSGRALFEVGY
jgi:hypothetical protein